MAAIVIQQVWTTLWMILSHVYLLQWMIVAIVILWWEIIATWNFQNSHHCLSLQSTACTHADKHQHHLIAKQRTYSTPARVGGGVLAGWELRGRRRLNDPFRKVRRCCQQIEKFELENRYQLDYDNVVAPPPTQLWGVLWLKRWIQFYFTRVMMKIV